SGRISPARSPNLGTASPASGKVTESPAFPSYLAGFALRAPSDVTTHAPTRSSSACTVRVRMPSLSLFPPKSCARSRHRSSSTSDDRAAAMALSGPVAFTQFQVARLTPGDWVLVTAAASGLGLVTSLVAKQLGARVIATSRKEWKREMLRGHGLEAVLDTDHD